MKPKNIWDPFYNPTHVMSTGKPYVFSIGVRSAGKSTGFLIFLLKEFIEKGRQFIYVRRTDKELAKTAEHAFDNAVTIYNRYYNGKRNPIDKFEYTAGKYYLDGELAGYAIPLNLQNEFKSLPFGDVFYIVYDEFLVSDETGGRYLGSKDNPFKEVEAIMSLYISVDRGIDRAYRNEVRVIFIGNNKKYTSPIFMRMNIDRYLSRESKFINPKNTAWVVEQTLTVSALDDSKNSNAYKLSTDFNKAYSFEGGLFDDPFIGRTDRRVNPMCNLKYKGSTFGVGVEQGGPGRLVIRSKKYAKCVELALTMDDHSPNYALAVDWRLSGLMVQIRDAITSGRVLYDTQRARYAVETFFSFIK